MAPQSWAQGTRHEYLNGYGPEYIAACKNHSQSQWFEKFYSMWFVLYHISLPDDFEPVPGAMYEELSNPEALRTYEKNLTKKQLALRHWFKHHWSPRKVHKDDEDSSTNVTKDIFPVLLPESLSIPNSMVEFPGIPKLHRKQLVHVYSALFYDEQVKPAIDIQLAIDYNQPLPSGKTIEIQQIIKERQTTDYENAVKVWEGRNTDLESLEKQQVACNNLNPWLEKVLLMIQEYVTDTENDVNPDEDDKVSHVNSNDSTNSEDVRPDSPLKTPDVSSTISLNEDPREDTLTDDATANQNQQEDSTPDDAMGLNPSQLEGVPLTIQSPPAKTHKRMPPVRVCPLLQSTPVWKIKTSSIRKREITPLPAFG
ncbi:hypothetical protein BS47DRAFT_1394375 [Hydnum rufescens UP504]|uniref:Uncharacterized protein n=1 Tax=Hydnum rufescens UP504 TaxID=1448309 RepID=A0A9P6AUK5_9AGAM|nr:hypothetical protein BS47DRAFT_1394375 [Hydnum rufescens UP504]